MSTKKVIECNRCEGTGDYLNYGNCYKCSGLGQYLDRTLESSRKAKLEHITAIKEIIESDGGHLVDLKLSYPYRLAAIAFLASNIALRKRQLATLEAELEVLIA